MVACFFTLSAGIALGGDQTIDQFQSEGKEYKLKVNKRNGKLFVKVNKKRSICKIHVTNLNQLGEFMKCFRRHVENPGGLTKQVEQAIKRKAGIRR